MISPSKYCVLVRSCTTQLPPRHQAKKKIEKVSKSFRSSCVCRPLLISWEGGVRGRQLSRVMLLLCQEWALNTFIKKRVVGAGHRHGKANKKTRDFAPGRPHYVKFHISRCSEQISNHVFLCHDPSQTQQAQKLETVTSYNDKGAFGKAILREKKQMRVCLVSDVYAKKKRVVFVVDLSVDL